MKGKRLRPAIALALLVAGAALVGSGFLVQRKLADPSLEGFDLSGLDVPGLTPFVGILEKDLLQDTTITGVVRRDGKLYSTYDRTQARGKRACPS